MLENLKISEDITIKEALKALDRGAERIVFVVNKENRLLGVLTDGDIRRNILMGKSLDAPIFDIYNKNPIVINRNEYSPELARSLMQKNRIEQIPIVTENKTLVDYISWDKVTQNPNGEKKARENIDIPVVIMAGGKGTRLAPFTSVLPKPLIPIGEKTVLEHIIDEFYSFGIRDFFLTLNYKGEMIRAYFEGVNHDYKLNYIWEKEFSGTAGSILLAKESLPDVFFVSNCDIIVKADYAEVLNFHKTSKADITVVSSIQHHVIPYGVVEFRNGGEVTGIVEKPEHSFPINTGLYILNKKAIGYIPNNKLFHMTHLIEAVIADKGKVVTYPVNENDYIDIGQWEEYKKATERINSL